MKNTLLWGNIVTVIITILKVISIIIDWIIRIKIPLMHWFITIVNLVIKKVSFLII